jgi:hypothetical protein
MIARGGHQKENGASGISAGRIRKGSTRGEERSKHTIELLEHALNSTRAAAAAHGNVEFVCVRHVVGCGVVVGELFVRYRTFQSGQME